jgi:pSer/pThr/pTyr-binding forkhead associated (FHA) protein
MDNDQQPESPKTQESEAVGHTTHDVRDEAEEALRRFRLQQSNDDDRETTLPSDATITVHLFLETAKDIVEVDLSVEAVVGRRDPTQNVAPEVDLTRYGAYQFGISRRHATLRLRDNKLELVDLGSRNGTFVNGYRCTPHVPVALADGDEVVFAKIVTRLSIHVDE